ncbi:Ig-like domain-containing protein, partial [Gammaproteobacteria bacterium AS21]
MGNSTYIEIINNDEYVNRAEIGDSSQTNSNLRVKLTIPEGARIGEYLSITVNGPNGLKGFVHQLVVNDFIDGVVNIPIPTSNVIGDDGSFIDGAYTLSMTVLNEFGAAAQISGNATFTLDTTPPELPISVTIVTGDDDVLSESELTTEVGIQIGIPESAVVGDVLEIDVDGDGVPEVIHEITATEPGTTILINIQGDEFLVDNDQVIASVVIKDFLGNANTAVTATVDVDNSPPSQIVVIDSIIDDTEPELGIVANGSPTNDITPTLNGRLDLPLKSDEKLFVFRDDVKIGEAAVSGSGLNVIWNFTDNDPSNPLVDGENYTYKVQVVDTAGNEGNESNTYSISIDTQKPEQLVTIDKAVDNENGISDLNSGDTTDDTSPQLMGTIDRPMDNDSVLNVIRNGQVIGQAIIDNSDPDNITWQFTDSNLADGSNNTYQVQVEDAASNLGTISNEFILNVDTTAPVQYIQITHAIDDEGDLINLSSGDTTNDISPELIGFISKPLLIGESIDVYQNDILIGKATIDDSNPANITWSYDLSGLSDGNSYNYQVQVVDQAGLTGDISNTFVLKLDTTNPLESAIIDSIFDNVENTGHVASGGYTDDESPQVRGSLSADLANGEVLVVWRNGSEIGNATINSSDPSNIRWTFDDFGLGENNTYEYEVQVKDLAGNLGPISNTYSITIDTEIPQQDAVITHALDNVGEHLTLLSGDKTDDQSPELVGTLSGPLAANESLDVVRNGQLIGQAVIDDSDPGNITWHFNDENLDNGGVYNYKVRVTDAANNLGSFSDSFKIIIDVTQPAPTITDVSDNIGDEQGSIAQGGTTDDAMPTITGSGEAGSIITLLDNGEVVGTGIVDGSGNWSIEPELPLLEGSHSFTAISTDAAGNASDPSAARTLVLDIPGPNAPAIDAVIDD